MLSLRFLVLLFGLALGWVGHAAAADQSWTVGTGEVTQGELVGYNWVDHQMTLDNGSTLNSTELDIISKLQLFITKPYLDSYQANLEAIQNGPYYKTRSQELKTIFLVLCVTYVVTLLSVTWVLASWIMRNGSAGPILKILALYAFLTACVVFLIRHFVPDFDPMGDLTVVLTGFGIYCLFFIILAMWIFKTSFIRAITWCTLTFLALLVLPVTMLLTGIGAQVYKMEGELTLPATDKYLTETWFEPLGLL